MIYLDEDRVQLKFEMPLGELIVDFYDQLKSKTQGYASLDYTFAELREGDLVKLDVLVNGAPVDALSIISHRDDAYFKGRELVSRTARSDSPPDVRCADSGVDRQPDHRAGNDPGDAQERALEVLWRRHSRKRKLLEKQKEGKARMKIVGSVEIRKRRSWLSSRSATNRARQRISPWQIP